MHGECKRNGADPQMRGFRMAELKHTENWGIEIVRKFLGFGNDRGTAPEVINRERLVFQSSRPG